jgi:hypothetical protein
MANGNEGSTPALGDAPACKLLDARDDTLKGGRDRAILATLLYHGIRREELCGLRVKDMQSRQGVVHFRVKGKRGKIRFVPVHVMAQRLIEAYLAVAGHGADAADPVFRPVTNNRTKELEKPLNPNSIYRNIILKYGLETGVSAEVNGLCVHSLRATAAANALSHEADIAKLQEWLGHANVSTTRLYDRRKCARRTARRFGSGTARLGHRFENWTSGWRLFHGFNDIGTDDGVNWLGLGQPVEWCPHDLPRLAVEPRMLAPKRSRKLDLRCCHALR